MAFADTFSAEIVARLIPKTTTVEGNVLGDRQATHKLTKTMTNGTGTSQAQGYFSTSFTATTGGITISLADSADPLGAAGDDTPTSDPEGLKLRGLLIENQDATNFVSFGQGTNGDTNVISGSTDTVRIDPGGLLLWYSPTGSNAMSDGVDDEVKLTADTASCTVKITYIFG